MLIINDNKDDSNIIVVMPTCHKCSELHVRVKHKCFKSILKVIRSMFVNNNNNPICKVPECQKTSVALLTIGHG